jgi:hypothetical protein
VTFGSPSMLCAALPPSLIFVPSQWTGKIF